MLCNVARILGINVDFVALGRLLMAQRNSLNTVVVCCSGVSVGRVQCVGYSSNVPDVWYALVAGT